jgi:polyribonucleotide nucleotidyltransferase
VEDVVKLGDEVMVMVIEVDSMGRVNLSRRAVLEGGAPPAPRPAGDRGSRGGFGGDRDRRSSGGGRPFGRSGGSSRPPSSSHRSSPPRESRDADHPLGKKW